MTQSSENNPTSDSENQKSLSPKKSLAQLLYDERELLLKAVDENGEIDELLYSELSISRGVIESKIDRIAGFLGYLQAQRSRIKIEVEARKDAVRQLDALEKRIEDGIKTEMRNRGLNSIDGVETTFVIWDSTPALVIENADEIPGEYWETKVDVVPNKAEIKKALLSGIPVKGCSIKSSIALKNKIRKL